MMTFKEFLEEEGVVTSRRQGIQHFHAMKPVEFIRWAKSVKKDMRGILSNIKTVLKVDGMGFRFGLDKNGKIFIEGSRTGPIFDSGAFSQYAISKGSSDEVIMRSRHYDDMLDAFKKLQWMKKLPNDVKVYCELFYNPMAEISDDGIKYVTVKYDKSKVGSVMTILPYDIFVASTGEVHPQKSEIMSMLYQFSDSKVKIIDPSLQMGSIDISGIINPIESMNDESIRILQSRKKEDKEAKANLITLIQKMKDELTDHIIFNPAICGLDKLCKPEKGEGIVLHLPHGTFKMTSKEFQQAHHG